MAVAERADTDPVMAEARTGADLSAFRRALAERRHPLDPPSPGQ